MQDSLTPTNPSIHIAVSHFPFETHKRSPTPKSPIGDYTQKATTIDTDNVQTSQPLPKRNSKHLREFDPHATSWNHNLFTQKNRNPIQLAPNLGHSFSTF